MKSKFVLIGFLCVLFFLFQNCTKKTHSKKWQGTIEDKEGVKVVKNPSNPIYDEISLHLKKDLSIGSEDDENYMFYKVFDMDVDSQGNIYVLDSGNYRIQKFDNKGQYLQTIGKKGQGPGEFERPIRVFLDAQNNIYVNDRRKIKIFNSQGEFLNSFLLDTSVTDFYIDGQGNILAQGRRLNRDGIKKVIIIMNSAGKTIKSIKEFPDFMPAMVNTGNSTIALTVPHEYSSKLFFVALDEQLFHIVFLPNID